MTKHGSRRNFDLFHDATTTSRTSTDPPNASQPLLGDEPRTDILTSIPTYTCIDTAVSYGSVLPRTCSCPRKTKKQPPANLSIRTSQKVFWSIAVALLWSSFLSSTDMAFVLADNSKIGKVHSQWYHKKHFGAELCLCPRSKLTTGLIT